MTLRWVNHGKENWDTEKLIEEADTIQLSVCGRTGQREEGQGVFRESKVGTDMQLERVKRTNAKELTIGNCGHYSYSVTLNKSP